MFSVSELKGILKLSQIVAIVLKIAAVGENMLPRAVQRFIKIIMLRWADQLPNKWFLVVKLTAGVRWPWKNTSLFQKTVNDWNEGILSFRVPEVYVATKVALTLIPGFKK